MLPNRSLVLRRTLAILRCPNEEIEHQEERGKNIGSKNEKHKNKCTKIAQILKSRGLEEVRASIPEIKLTQMNFDSAKTSVDPYNSLEKEP